MIDLGRIDLELIEKEFGELIIEEPNPQTLTERIMKIIKDFPIDLSLNIINKNNLNQNQLIIERQKYEVLLQQLRKINDQENCEVIDQLKLLISQIQIVVKLLKASINQELEIFQVPIFKRVNDLKEKFDEFKTQYDDQNKRDDKDRQLNQINNQIIVENKNNVQNKIRTNLSIIISIIQLLLIKTRQERQKLAQFLENVKIFTQSLDIMQEGYQEIYISFSNFFKKHINQFMESQCTKANLQQLETESNKEYFSRIEIITLQGENQTDKNINQSTNIVDFLYKLMAETIDKLIKFKWELEIQFDQEYLIQLTKKIYLQENDEEYEVKSDPQGQISFDEQNNDEWKIKQGLVLTIIQISLNNFTETITRFCQKALIQLWVLEKDQRVRNLLKNQDLIKMQMKILQKDWQTQNDRIAREMQQMLARIDELQEQISQECNINKRDQYLKEMDQTTLELDEYIENISEMGQQLRLVTDFVNHLRKGLIRVEGKINEMKKQLNSMGNDIKFLRGKSVAQLFEIRKWKVLKEAAYKNVKSIYVPLQTVEIFHKAEKVEKKTLLNNEQMYKVDEDYNDEQGHYKDDKNQNDEEKDYDVFQKKREGGKKQKPSILINLEQLNDREGEVNEFLLDEKETVLLIHGVAGSGKSTTAKKIEEFIWKLHDINQKIGNHVLIPVYISLPSLKNPVFQAVEEALHQDEYGFDDLQLKECKEMLEKKKFRFLLIIDGYDEMKLENIQKNLYINNKLKNNWFDPLVIFTTRSEIFTSSNYALWFQPDDKHKLKEIQLQKFDSKQMMEYLKKYTIQSVKMLIFDIYEWQTTISNRGAVDINKFEICWDQIHQLIKFNFDQLLNQQSIDHVLSFLKNDELLALKNPDALRNLSIHLHKLWGVKKYQNMMTQINLHKSVETPYMMEIIVQVLPEMMVKATEVINLKQNFKKNFPNMLKEFYKSKYLIRMYQQQLQKYLTTQSHKNEEESLKSNDEVIVKKKLEDYYNFCLQLI